MNEAPQTPSKSLWQVMWYMLSPGIVGLAGPAALAGCMHRHLVEDRKWISEAEYKEGLALAQSAPGHL